MMAIHWMASKYKNQAKIKRAIHANSRKTMSNDYSTLCVAIAACMARRLEQRFWTVKRVDDPKPGSISST